MECFPVEQKDPNHSGADHTLDITAGCMYIQK
jgi:hypothetical protein